MLLNEQDIIQAVHTAVEPLMERIEALTLQVEALQANISPKTPAVAGQKEAAEYLGISPRTLQRRQEDWIEGIHWWRDSQSKRPIYNLTLIRDGQRQGFNSKDHLMSCKRWLNEQKSLGQK